MRQLHGLKHPTECREVFLDELETLAFGQGLELHWRFKTKMPSTQEYLVMVDNKTGGLFGLVLRLLEIESESQHTPELLHFLPCWGGTIRSEMIIAIWLLRSIQPRKEYTISRQDPRAAV
ncbi:hypothetical protein BJX70DRAFT_359575 [Aspergillus crustosus]